MKNQTYSNSNIFMILVLSLFFLSCNNPEGKKDKPQSENQPVCTKNLSYNECANPPAMHGQLMVHNMTNKSFEVKIEHHDNMYETKRIAPGDGWTFNGVIQGKRLISAKASLDGEYFEANCTIGGNMQDNMNIMNYGFKMQERRVHTGHN
jgi:hypothetical protein